MSYVLDEIINQKLKTAFAGLGLDTKYAAAKTSDRPDLSDFQCNGALALAKSEKKNPRQIGEEIAARLREDKDFARVSVDGPGFLNLTLTDEFLAGVLDKMAADERFGCALQENPKTVVMDYGGPNVAKEMHVGHLRSGVIGESMRRIEEFVGNKPVADVHFGDWGTPIGMILAEVIAADGSLDKMEAYDIAEITGQRPLQGGSGSQGNRAGDYRQISGRRSGLPQGLAAYPQSFGRGGEGKLS